MGGYGSLMYLDAFAGPGGWDVACRSLGIEALGIEIDLAACATRRAASLWTIQDDITKLDPADFGEVTGFIASPPCRDWSRAGSQKGWDGESGFLVKEALRWSLALKPTWIAFEQVPAVLPIWEMYGGLLRQRGYSVWVGYLHAEQYGVPQTRKRAILMAHQDKVVRPPTPTHSKFHRKDPTRIDPGTKKWVSMAEALGWEEGKIGFPRTGDDLGPVDPNGFRARDFRDVSEPSFTVTSRARDWVYRRPSPTIVGSFRPDIVAAPKWRTTTSRQDQEGSVLITLEQAAKLQSFPDGYPWCGAKAKKFQQVGDAIPPLLAQAVISQLV